MPFLSTTGSRGHAPEAAQTWSVVLQRLSGLVLLGLVPGLIALRVLPGDLRDYGLGAGDPQVIGWALLLALPLLAVIYTASGSEEHQARYPMIRAEVWSPRLVALNASSWAAYLVGYELLFRGVLL